MGKVLNVQELVAIVLPKCIYRQEQPQADEFDDFEDGNNAIGSCVAIYAYEGG